MAELVVQLEPDVAAAFRGRAAHPAGDRLRAYLRQSNVVLEPLDPDFDEPPISTYFTVHLKDVSLAQRLAAGLLELQGVEAAYVKPGTAAP